MQKNKLKNEKKLYFLAVLDKEKTEDLCKM
jgi:hypothetical protein